MPQSQTKANPRYQEEEKKDNNNKQHTQNKQKMHEKHIDQLHLPQSFNLTNEVLYKRRPGRVFRDTTRLLKLFRLNISGFGEIFPDLESCPVRRQVLSKA